MTMGAVAAVFAKKYKRFIIGTIGTMTVLFGYLGYNGLIRINPENFKKFAKKRRLINFFAFAPPGFGIGFYLGIKNEFYNLI